MKTHSSRVPDIAVDLPTRIDADRWAETEEAGFGDLGEII
jgi:hypothetical protein